MKALAIALVIGLGLALAATRATCEGGRALDDGDAAARRGDTAEAIAHYRRAARWYVPVVGATGDAIDRLEKIAAAAQQRGDRDTELAAWQAERSALVAIRGIVEPFSDRRRRADEHIAQLLTAAPGPRAAGATPAERATWYAAMLRHTPGADRGALALAALGLIGWLAGTVQLARRRGTRSAAALVIAGAGLWCAGLLLA